MRNRHLRTGDSVYHVEAKLYYLVKGLEAQAEKDIERIAMLEKRINQLENKD